ncbi:MAG: sigma-70 family RNA polymerase sigma factor [Candidatus Marinimicrobia bacterium]|jgi:RNA polymerase sigma-70 factor (ECF subfamily)|nr:sigma-70 family RNA polymerase sigma factor [Candidatus Neomarinimicrobiota bacterium]
MKTDHELIKEFQDGNEAAFNELVKRHLPDTYGFFIKFTKDEIEAEDLAQDVFIKMFKALKKFRFESEFKTYLFRANINMSNSYLRRNKWRNLLHLDQMPEPGYMDTSHEDEWRRKELWDAVAILPSRQRMVVTMRIAQEMPYREISEIMGISENSAKVNYHHAVKTLKDFFED